MLKNTFHPNVFMIAALLVFALLVVPHALAVTFKVNSTDDLPDDLSIPGTCHTAVNTCTLRAAVMQANRNSGLGATIIVPAGIYKLTIPAAGLGGEENGDLNLTTPATGNPVITIIGAGASMTIIDGNQLDRVFQVHQARTTTISGVTIRNGYVTGSSASAYGGGITNQGLLTLSNALIYGNHAERGGGINTTSNSIDSGLVTVMNSMISQNTATYGGGIYNNGNLIIINGTIYGNAAYDGGGIINNNKNLFVVNSTISNNSANNSGGGIYNLAGAANVYNSTITANGSDNDRDPIGGIGGGVYNGSVGTFNLRNTLVAGNYTQNAPVPDDCAGTIGSFGRNLFGDLNGCTVNVGSGSWDYFAGGLGPLQNNGGPTWTHALRPGSNAIDHGDPVLGCIGPDGLPLATDQRGAARVVGNFCDIGAFEHGAKVPWLYLPLILG